MDIVRVFRVVQIVGPRDAVERQLANSLHGTRNGCLGDVSRKPCQITVHTMGEFPEILPADENPPAAA